MTETRTDVAADQPLDERKAAILRAIVADYVATGEAVGSKRVVDVAKLDVSAATVRAEMSALEDAGYISQPHTSAGRIPTHRGYRYFVDELQNLHAVDGDIRQREAVAQLLGTATGVEEVLKRTTQVLSHLTNLVSLVIAPAVNQSRLKLLELVSLTPNSLLLLLVTDTGRVQKVLLELHRPVIESDISRAKTVLAENTRGIRVGDLNLVLDRLIEDSPKELRELFEAVGAAVIELATPEGHRVFVGGRAALAERSGLERTELSRVLELLEERVTLARLLAESTVDDQLHIRIGQEHTVEELQPTSLVAQRYQLLSSGSIGVLGPIRMDYANVLSTVRAVAETLQLTLQNLNDED